MAAEKRESEVAIQSERDLARHPNQKTADKIAADTARYEALAREHGADLSEEGFNEALSRVARHKPPKRG